MKPDAVARVRTRDRAPDTRVVVLRDWWQPAARLMLLAWVMVTTFIILFTLQPQAAAADSALRLHGALHREDAIGIVSHRGAAALAPENTLSALQVAIDQGVDFIETDVQLTADGVPVLMHDPTFDRTTNGSGPIWQRTLAEVKQLDAGGWFAGAFLGEPVPTLDEFFDLLDGAPTRALIELKGEWDVAEIEGVVAQLRERGLVHRVALQSFEVPTLELLQAYGPEFARVLLTREWDETVVDLAGELQASAVGARPSLFEERPELIGEMRVRGIGTLVYTLNTETGWERAAELGADLVVTDDPVSLADWLQPVAATSEDSQDAP